MGCVFGTHDTRKGWINRLAVDPDYRRRGIATRLVLDCERRLHRQGMEIYAALVESDNRASRAVFRSLDYDLVTLVYARKKRRPDI